MALRLTTGQARQLLRAETQTAAQSLRNTRNRAAGQRFEDRLEAYHNGLVADGQAMIMRTNPKIRVTSPGKAVIVGKGEVDYIAFLPTGRVIHFDAKSRKDKAFTLDDQHQIAWLRAMSAFGQRHWGSFAGKSKRPTVVVR